MPYCKEFTDLFSAPQFEVFRKQYSFFDEKDLSETYLENLIKANNFGQASIWLKGLYETYTKRKSGLPFHIGLGNPDARILFVGKELGIDVNYPNPPQLLPSIPPTRCPRSAPHGRLWASFAHRSRLPWMRPPSWRRR